MTVDEILEQAARLVERGWTQRAYARDDNDTPVLATSPEAVCWCLGGAIMAAGRGHFPEANDAIQRVKYQIKSRVPAFTAAPSVPVDLGIYNDTIAQSAADVAGILRASKPLVQVAE